VPYNAPEIVTTNPPEIGPTDGTIELIEISGSKLNEGADIKSTPL